MKEIEEETGFKAEVKRLLAVLDKRNYAHPLQPHYVYKLCYLCEITAGDFAPNFDIGEVHWFALDALPELSEDRILEEQLSKLVAIAKGNEAVFSD